MKYISLLVLLILGTLFSGCGKDSGLAPTTAASDSGTVISSCDNDGASVGGVCWYLGADQADCDATCSTHGGYNDATKNYAGSGVASAQHCVDVMEALNVTYSIMDYNYTVDPNQGFGCYYHKTLGRFWTPNAATTSTAAYPDVLRVCACNN